MKVLLFLIVLAAAGTLYALYMVVAPFLESRPDQIRRELLDREFRELEELTARKSVLLQTLRDIESDYETGKLSEEDYENMKEEYERRAVRIMQKIDDLRTGADVEEDLDALIEEALESSDEPASPDEPSPSQSDHDASVPCPACGTAVEPRDRFCSQCGEPLDGDDESPATGTDDVRAEAAG